MGFDWPTSGGFGCLVGRGFIKALGAFVVGRRVRLFELFFFLIADE